MVKCRKCKRLKVRTDICTGFECPSRATPTATMRKGSKSRFAITAMYNHGFHEELALGRRA
jgi:hypothetical protein